MRVRCRTHRFAAVALEGDKFDASQKSATVDGCCDHRVCGVGTAVTMNHVPGLGQQTGLHLQSVQYGRKAGRK